MKLSANVIGATGLVGEQLVKQLIEHPKFETIRIFVRKGSGIRHPKIIEEIIDFNQPETWRNLVNGHVLFSTLGTTLKTAKTKENQYRVDFRYQYEFAKAAAENKVPVYVLVSSMGASAKSKVFYSRMKGELEEAIQQLNFPATYIFQPSILDGNRKESRPAEKIGLSVMRFLTRFAFRKYKPTPADVLAAKMIRLALKPANGFRIIEGLEIFGEE